MRYFGPAALELLVGAVVVTVAVAVAVAAAAVVAVVLVVVAITIVFGRHRSNRLCSVRNHFTGD